MLGCEDRYEERCGERYEGVKGGVRKCVGVWGEVEKDEGKGMGV